MFGKLIEESYGLDAWLSRLGESFQFSKLFFFTFGVVLLFLILDMTR